MIKLFNTMVAICKLWKKLKVSRQLIVPLLLTILGQYIGSKKATNKHYNIITDVFQFSKE